MFLGLPILLIQIIVEFSLTRTCVAYTREYLSSIDNYRINQKRRDTKDYSDSLYDLTNAAQKYSCDKTKLGTIYKPVRSIIKSKNKIQKPEHNLHLKFIQNPIVKDVHKAITQYDEHKQIAFFTTHQPEILPQTKRGAYTGSYFEFYYLEDINDDEKNSIEANKKSSTLRVTQHARSKLEWSHILTRILQNDKLKRKFTTDQRTPKTDMTESKTQKTNTHEQISLHKDYLEPIRKLMNKNSTINNTKHNFNELLLNSSVPAYSKTTSPPKIREMIKYLEEIKLTTTHEPNKTDLNRKVSLSSALQQNVSNETFLEENLYEDATVVLDDKVKFFEEYDSPFTKKPILLNARENVEAHETFQTTDNITSSPFTTNSNLSFDILNYDITSETLNLKEVDQDNKHVPENHEASLKGIENLNSEHNQNTDIDTNSYYSKILLEKNIQFLQTPKPCGCTDRNPVVKTEEKRTVHNLKIAKRESNKENSSKDVNNANKSPFFKRYLHRSRKAPWNIFSFAAVYVYEPYHIHCDAAAISAHWLIASGACLSRHSYEPSATSRTPFVSYCGVNWREPERVTYVKYIIIHPNFHPRDNKRKHMYNIGAIQVVNSMLSSCAGWSPVQILTRQYQTKAGKYAVALGWGVDRYGVKYNAQNLPKWPLMAYSGMTYSETCPGNNGYNKFVPRSNMYCLTLPEYSGEQNDPVHGGLLLVNGKLVGLYLQEERHSKGEQSAIYTGVWRLLPWVNEVAIEPKAGDLLQIDD